MLNETALFCSGKTGTPIVFGRKYTSVVTASAAVYLEHSLH